MKPQKLNNTIKLNIGLDVGTTKEALTVFKVKGALVKNYSQPKTMTGTRITSIIFKDSDTELTAVVTVKTSLGLADALKATRQTCLDLEQIAIALKYNGEGHLVYATDALALTAEYGTEFNAEYWLE